MSADDGGLKVAPAEPTADRVLDAHHGVSLRGGALFANVAGSFTERP